MRASLDGDAEVDDDAIIDIFDDVTFEVSEDSATHCSTLQHTAAYYDAVQRIATQSNTLHRIVTHCNTLQHTTTSLQHAAAYCNTLQHTCLYSDAEADDDILWFMLPSRSMNTLQHTATHCNTLQHTATHYNTLQCNQDEDARKY